MCPDDCQDGEVRLQDGTASSNGRVELCLNGIWGSVCSSQWDDTDASVVCRELGYDPQGESELVQVWFLWNGESIFGGVCD